MIHPDTELRFVNEEIGYGVFATRPIPMGTIVYVRDMLEIEFTHRQFEQLDAAHRAVVNKYSYIDQRGMRILSWDHAKYVNHCCECNTISTGYGFEIAIHDIDAGEEITNEYGLFNLQEPMVVNCGCSDCRGVVDPADAERYAPKWDASVIAALDRARQVQQPLWHLLDRHTSRALQGFLSGKLPYRSVGALRWGRPRPCGNQHGNVLVVSGVENRGSRDEKSAQGNQEPSQQQTDSRSAEDAPAAA